MANAIELAKSYVPKLDEVYKLASLTAMLDGASDLARQGANASELIIPMMTMDGLADYSRNSGYVQGDVTLTNETVKCNFDRGRRFTVDTMDDLETAGLAFGRLSAEFIRTKVVPELDAFRFAAYCGKTGVTKVEGALADGSAVLQALRAASTALDEAEVPLTERYLFITPSLHGMVEPRGAEQLCQDHRRAADPLLHRHQAAFRREHRERGRLHERRRRGGAELYGDPQARRDPVHQAHRAQDH